jgi:uncharacterized protein DUF6541
MLIGFLYAAVACLCGAAVARALRLPLSLAPWSGLATVVVLAVWCAALGVAPAASTALILVIAAAGAWCLLRAAAAASRTRHITTSPQRLSVVFLVAAVALPSILLGVAFAGLEAPVSTHDGAFHVETVDAFRLGATAHGWYPTGFHASVAAVLRLTPWVDSARGTVDAALGLAMLAPLAAFSVALALGLDILVAAVAALVLAVTWQYPYDYHLWAGWPQGMGVLFLIGLCATVLHWVRRPGIGLAIVTGLLAGAIVLTHGTEVYSAVLALLVIGAWQHRRLKFGYFVRHAPVAAGIAIACTAPYLSTLLGWAGTGGASAAGEATVALTDIDSRGDWLQFALGVTGAGSSIDLPVRVALIGLGLFVFRARLAGALWAIFVALLLVNDLVSAPLVTKIFTVTYPWLDHDRPRQVAVVFASILCAGGASVCIDYVRRLRMRVSGHPAAFRRMVVGFGLVAFFFLEGSGVSIYKRTVQAVADQNVYTADDAAAMAWLRAHVAPGEIIANDRAGDAGIWAPYKADVPILLPRSASDALVDARQPVLDNILKLDAAPLAEHTACTLHVEYLFHGAAPRAFDERQFQDRGVLEGAANLQEVFVSGEASVFKIQLPCN